MKEYAGYVLGAIGVVAFLCAMTMWVIVGSGETGVVTQFGKVTGREMSPGFNVKLPWPIQGVWIANVQVQKEQVEAKSASKDLQQVDSTIAVNYHLDKAKVGTIYSELSVDYKNRIIDPAIQEVFKATTANYDASDLLTKRSEVKATADRLLSERLSKYGIFTDDLSIVDFNFSDDYNKAIESKQVAQQAAQQAQYALDKAKLDAQAQESQKQSLTQEILTQQFLNKWDGKLPTYMGTNNIMGIPINK